MAEEDNKKEGRATRILAGLGVLVTVVAGGTSLVFYLRPSWKPCLGGANASFTGAPVFPHDSFRAHLIREGVSKQDLRGQGNVSGAEVRLSYHANNLRGAKLPLTWTLVKVAKDGTVQAVVPSQDRAFAVDVTPDSCSESGGYDLFVPIAPRKQHQAPTRYKVVLELFP